LVPQRCSVKEPERTNVAAEPRHAETLRDLARWLPKVNTFPVPGSKTRLIELRDGEPIWEGQAIGPNDPVAD